jgi:hypothetical protein
VKHVVLATILFSAAALAAPAGLQDQPVGTHVNGSFDLGPKRIHAPSGDWTLIASHKWTGTTNMVLQGTNFAGVYLAEIKDGRLTRALQAWGNIDPNLARGWRHPVDPCKKRDNVLVYRDLSQNIDNLFCFDVSELRGYMRKSTAWRQQAQQWLEAEKVKLPENVLMVRFAKLERAYWTEVYYYFEPKEFSGQTLAQQAEAAGQWADEVAPLVRAGLNTPGP